MDELLRWRNEFPILQTTTYMISHSLGAMPRKVHDRLHEFADVWATRGVRAWAEGWWAMPVTVGDMIGRIIGASPGDVVMHQNVSVAQSVICSCFDFAGPRNKIVYEALNFPTVMYVYEAQRRYGARIVEVQARFGPLFNAQDMTPDGSVFDTLFDDGDVFEIGALKARVLHTPGHTPACVTYVIDDAAFVGDTLFMPDYGTARADFPGGDARTLYRSIRRLLALPPETRLFMCHDYLPPGRGDFVWETTVAQELAHNVHVKEGVSEDQFVAMREARDKTLSAPVLLLPSIQVNMRAGKMPPADSNGVHYIKVPVTLPKGVAA